MAWTLIMATDKRTIKKASKKYWDRKDEEKDYD